MTSKVASLVFAVLLITRFGHGAEQPQRLVPDAETAIRVAVAIWIPIYGEANIERQKPYRAFLKDGVWNVSGHLPKDRLGGVAMAEISERDGRVLKVTHGR